jgi:ATP-dependent 26S proteasome regulatory subunit
MDLNQRKLIKSEWDSIEIPFSKAEIDVLNLIISGFHDVNIKINYNESLFTFLKIDYNTKMEDFIYNKYLREEVEKIVELYKQIKNNSSDKSDNKNDINSLKINVSSDIQIKSADKIRLEKNNIENLKNNNIYEYVLLEHVNKILIAKKNRDDDESFVLSYFTLYKLLKNNITKINRHIVALCEFIVKTFENDLNIMNVIENAVELIEKNTSLLKYTDMTLYEHQKEIFTICKNPQPKLILYMAPPGTGKTLTPIGLSEKYRIIFVCAARHVGLALARAAISVNKKIAFAFGCASADDIRLHYFAAKDYSVNKRTGGIKKVDNSNGINVEIIISDIKSFIPAMYYMRAFNDDEKLMVYWDEPTITLDYDEHSFHSIIKNNWSENKIPNVVLSSATLPKENELSETIRDFKCKFSNSEVHSIISHDCKKSIPIINKDGFVEMPHFLSCEYNKILEISRHCENYLTLLRYLDLNEVVKFVTFVNQINVKVIPERFRVENYFESLDDINMKNIKMYYIKLLKNITPTMWESIYSEFKNGRLPQLVENNSVDLKGNRIPLKQNSLGPGSVSSNNTTLNLQGQPLKRSFTDTSLINKPNPTGTGLGTLASASKTTGTSAIYVTTKDAYTLTDGPTIFICDDIEKIAKFCIQQANIPSLVMDDLMKKIEYNNVLNKKIDELEKDVDYLKEAEEAKLSSSTDAGGGGNKGKSLKNVRKFNREADNMDTSKGQVARLTREIETFRQMIKNVSLNETFVPNKLHHVKKWAENVGLDSASKAFTSNIEESIVNDIMLLNGIEDTWKILLMMGIGVFINHENIRYTEIMKKMADEQRLYLIIASSDYIYGTNYQFCHGYISKGMNLTQEKIIQAMGRIGRNNIQQTYSLRFRDDDQIMKIFTADAEKPEIINMNLLFNSNKIIWRDNQYVEVDVEVDVGVDMDVGVGGSE